MDAEAAYFFRHALMRDGAYQMQMPQDRAAQHRMVLEIAERLWGAPPGHDSPDEKLGDNLDVDPHVEELCDHAEGALTGELDDDQRQQLHSLLGRYLRRAGQLAGARFENAKVAEIYARLATEFAAETGKAVKDFDFASNRARFDDMDLAEDLAQRALDEAGRTGSRTLQIKGLLACSRVSFTRRNFKLTMGYLTEAEKLIEPDMEPDLVGEVLVTLATTSVYLEDSDECERRVKASLDYCKVHNLPTHEWMTLSNYAILFGRHGDSVKGEEILRQAIAHPAYNPDHIGTPYVHGNLAEELAAQGKLDESETQFRIALTGHRRFGNLLQQGWIGATLAKLLNRTDQHEEALEQLKKAMEALNRIGHLVWMGGLYMEMGRTFLLLGQSEKAEEAFAEAVKMQQKHEPERLDELKGRISETRLIPKPK
ncbi:tetratricopeptide repeat protein [Planctomycetota bacterium]|nr:tetratricopeptide repeat protein [Planctomycetota bacterium]